MPLPNTFAAASARGYGAFGFQSPSDPNFSSVSLLLPGNGTNGAQNNTFLDGSANNFTITRNGNTTQGSFSPFPPASGSAWSAAANGGSGYFDGSGDYLSAPSNAAFALPGDFTFEAWIYPTSWAATFVPVFTVFLSATGGFWVGKNGSNFVLRAASVADQLTTTTFPTLNTWTHLAVVRNGTTATIYYNGVSIVSGTVTYSFGQEQANIASDTSGNNFPGYISNLRLVKGTAVYTAAFTPPTAPLTAISGTSLLLNFTNGAIYDAAAKNDLETVGNAQTSTTQSKWGGSSMYFDGTGDWLASPDNNLFDFGAGNFTIEMWVYPTAVGQSSLTVLYCKPNGSGYSGIAIGQAVGGYGAVIYASSNGTSWNLASGVSAGTMTANAWNHVAVTRSGTNIYGFVGGALGSTTAVSTTALVSTTTQVSIGSSLGTANTYLTGYLQDFRITKGVARYTSNFTPPTAPFPVR